VKSATATAPFSAAMRRSHAGSPALARTGSAAWS